LFIVFVFLCNNKPLKLIALLKFVLLYLSVNTLVGGFLVFDGCQGAIVTQPLASFQGKSHSWALTSSLKLVGVFFVHGWQQPQ
jgi:hypothetical protein